MPRLSFRGFATRLRERGPAASIFRKGDRGGIAVTFALCLIPLILACGAAIDFARVVTARSALQAAVDAATLAVGASSSFNQTDAGPVMQNYLAANPVGGTSRSRILR
jgi:Flp pilus assembly protein TadG